MIRNRDFVKKTIIIVLFFHQTTEYLGSDHIFAVNHNLMDMRRAVILFLLFLCSFSSAAQGQSEMALIADFLGTDSEEELDAYEVEKLEEYLRRPLLLNIYSSSRLVSSGLLTEYQVASLQDYRNNNGDVLSLSELAALDGYGRDFVERIAPFISFESYAKAGQAAGYNAALRKDISVRSSFRSDMEDGRQMAYGLKYRVEAGERLSAAVAFSRSYEGPSWRPQAFSGHVAWYFKRRQAKLVAGDFNARFGQGLAFWNGMVLSGLASPTAYLRRASAISQSWSFTGSSAMTGLAASMMAGRTSISAVLSMPGIKNLEALSELALLPALNLTRHMRNGQVSATSYVHFSPVLGRDVRIPDLKSSVDARFCLNGTDIFAEGAMDWVTMAPAFLAGTTFPAGEDLRLAAMLRFYPPDFNPTFSGAPRSGTKCRNEHALSFSGEFSRGDYVAIRGAEGFGSSVRKHKGTFSLDAVYFPESKSEQKDVTCQAKLLLTWQCMLTDALRLSLRLNERIRNWEERIFKTDFRSDLSYISGRFQTTLRLNVMDYIGTGFLSYLEGTYKYEVMTLHLRQGLFLINNWDDRIYAYEHDAPGSFTVPAYYGRGVWTAFTASLKFSGRGRLYARASFISYPMMRAEKKKPGRAELKLQYVLSF